MTEALPKSAEEMRDILDIESLPPSFWALFTQALPYVAAVFLLLVALYLLYRLMRFLKSRSTPALPPFEQALAGLSQLATRLDAPAVLWTDYYFDLTHVLKRYLTDEPKWDALDKTTDEIRRTKSKCVSLLGETEWQHFIDFLVKSDGIKFAKAAVSDEEARRDLDWVRALITDIHDKQAQKPTGRAS